MSSPERRLAEARKQLDIVADELDDETAVFVLESVVERIHGVEHALEAAADAGRP